MTTATRLLKRDGGVEREIDCKDCIEINYKPLLKYYSEDFY